MRRRPRSQPRPSIPAVPGISVCAIALERTRALRHEILRAHEPIAALADAEPPGAHAVGAFDDGTLVAVGFVFADEPPASWRVRGMATAPAARGRGAGSAVLDGLVAHARGYGARRVWCNARSPARGFYERAGFRVCSEEFELAKIGPHFVMELTL